MTKYQGRASALRWSGLGEFLIDVAWNCGVSYRVISEMKGLLRTTIYFEVEGADEDVERYSRLIKRAFADYNQEGLR